MHSNSPQNLVKSKFPPSPAFSEVSASTSICTFSMSESPKSTRTQAEFNSSVTPKKGKLFSLSSPLTSPQTRSPWKTSNPNSPSISSSQSSESLDSKTLWGSLEVCVSNANKRKSVEIGLIRDNSDNSNIHLNQREILIGRSVDANIQLPHSIKILSNKHATIQLLFVCGEVIDKDNSNFGYESFVCSICGKRGECGLLPFITDNSANGTYINNEKIPKGVRVPLKNGNKLSFVQSASSMDKGIILNTKNQCPSFIFHNLLPTVHNFDSHFLECLQQATNSLNYSGNSTNTINTAQRMEMLSQGVNLNIVTHHKIPEHYIHVLKVEPTLSNLALLGNVLRSCGTTPQNIKWLQDFLSLGGTGAILDVISINNRKSRTFEADTRIDLECLRMLDVITSQSTGMEAFLKVSTHPLNDVVFTLLNPNHSYNVKSFVFTLLSRICSFSEAGYQCVMFALDRLKETKRDRVRFKFLVESLLIEQDSNYRANCMELINQIISSPSSLSQRAKIKREFVNLGILRIIDLLSQDHTPALEKQLRIFSCHMDEDQMWFRTINLNDSLSLCKTIQDIIKVDQKDLMESFNCILRRVLSIISDTEGTKESLELIEKFAGIVALQPKNTKLLDEENSSVTELVVNNSRLINQFTQKFLPSPSQPLSQSISNPDSTNKNSSLNINNNNSNNIESQNYSHNSVENQNNDNINVEEVKLQPLTISVPKPPPPPMIKPSILLVKKKAEAPSVPMKQLFWTKITARNITKTLWESSSKSVESSETITESEAEKEVLDKKELESLFYLPSKSNVSTPVGRSNNVAKEISILDTKRFNNIGIIVARFKMNPQNVLADLLTMDDDSLTKEKVQAFTKCVPTQDEEGLLRSYSGERPLSNVDLVLCSLISIPKVKERLECIDFQMQFEGMMDEVTSTVSNLDKACDALMKGNNLKQFLQIILKVGNYMNSQSPRGDALGFKLNFLLSLSETKSTDKKTTLLHYLALVLHRKYPECLKLIGEELKYADPLSRIQWKEVLSQFEQIKFGMKKIEQELNILQKSTNPANSPHNQEDRFPQIMSKFLLKYSKEVEKLQVDLQSSDSKFAATSLYFGEEGVNPEDFFSLLRDFNSLLKKAQNDNEREKMSTAKKRTENVRPKKQDTLPVVVPSSPKKTPLSPKSFNSSTTIFIPPSPSKYITPQKSKEPKETEDTHQIVEKLLPSTPSTPLEAEAMLLYKQLFKKNSLPTISPAKNFLLLPKSPLPLPLESPTIISTFSLNPPPKTTPIKQFVPITPPKTQSAPPPNATLFGFTKDNATPKPLNTSNIPNQPSIKTTSASSEQSGSSFMQWLKKKNPPT